MLTDIRQLLPTDVYQALINANSPSAGNPYATLADITGGVTTVTGTPNRITSTGGATPVIDISAAYAGQSSITTVGTLTGGATGAGFTVALGVSTVTGALAAVNGGTGQILYTVGDLLQASTTTALSKLAAVATGNVLISGGVGVVSSWGKVGLTTHVSGTLPIANGGSGQTTANTALNAFLPSQTSNSGKVLSTDGTNTSWVSTGFTGGGTDTVIYTTAANTVASTSSFTYNQTTGFAVKGVGVTSANYASRDLDSTGRALFQVRNDGVLEAMQMTSTTGVLVKNLVIGTPGITLNSFTTGTSNVIIGAMQSIAVTTAGSLLLMGDAGRKITIGGSNVGLGSGALDTLVSGTFNTAVGVNALSVLTGGNVTAVGNAAAQNLTSGAGGVFIGDNAGTRFSSGTAITAVGYYAGERASNSASFAGCTYLGREAEANDTAECVVGGVTPTKFYFGRGKFSADADDTVTSYIFSIPSVDATGNGMSRTAVTNGTSLFDTVWRPSAGTGTGASGKIIFQRGVPGSSGSVLNTFADAMTFQGKNITYENSMSVIKYGSANNKNVDQPILYGATTDAATAVELTIDGAAGSGTTNRIIVPTDTSLSIVLNIGVKQSGSANSKQMLRQVVITNNGGTTSIEGTVVALGTDSGSAGLATVTCTITANNTDDCLKVEVNGVALTNLRYTCNIVSASTLYA